MDRRRDLVHLLGLIKRHGERLRWRAEHARTSEELEAVQSLARDHLALYSKMRASLRSHERSCS
jgi:hypothetical protein